MGGMYFERCSRLQQYCGGICQSSSYIAGLLAWLWVVRQTTGVKGFALFAISFGRASFAPPTPRPSALIALSLQLRRGLRRLQPAESAPQPTPAVCTLAPRRPAAAPPPAPRSIADSTSNSPTSSTRPVEAVGHSLSRSNTPRRQPALAEHLPLLETRLSAGAPCRITVL